MPKRLLIITDEMEMGGTQRQIVELAKFIDHDAFNLSLVYFRNGSPYVDELREAGVEVTLIQKRWKLDPMFFLRLCRFVRRGEFDLVHAFSFSGEAWGWLANLVSGQGRFISSVRSVYEWYTPLQWSIKRWLTLNSAALVANSKAGAEHAAFKMGVRQELVDVVHNSVCMPSIEIDKDDAVLQVTHDVARVVFVGRLVDHKNVACLLRAFALVAEQGNAAQLDIVGDGPKRAELETLAKSLGVESRVNFHGERRDVGRFLHRSDIYVLTSYREGLCNAVMEAMSAGLAVIATNVGGNCELVSHGHSGLLFPSDDHETLATMLLELLSDKEKRQELGGNARAAMQRFHDPRRMAAEMERIYERCLVEEKAFVMGR
ncbi:MAG TPA: glycosyltransferase [Gammaproteobacteria bacterium]